ncbi:MAG: site-specific integrase [Actinomycetota bacterium]|nr:site-specific integrase [Actinomycetota bacterium]
MSAERNASGESTIYRDHVGRWHGNVSMGVKAGGVRDRRHVSGERRADVVAKVRQLEQRRDEGVLTTTGRTTVAAWLTHWLDSIAARKVRPSTLDGYGSLIRVRIIPALGHHRLDRLQPEHLERFYAAMTAEGLSGATVLKMHRVMSRAFTVAVQRGRVARNVCRLVDAPSVVRREVRPLTAAEARALLQTAKGQRNAARWTVALSLGLRQGEALGLPWAAVDLDVGTLTVRQALQRQRGVGLVIVEPKSAAGHRTITLPPSLRDALRVQRVEQAAERLAAGSEWADHRLVFAQVNGRPVDHSADYAAWKALLRAAGVRDARLHDARHTAATLLLQQGVPARVAMEILGHSQISLTLNTYSHVVPELARDAALRMEKALWG